MVRRSTWIVLGIFVGLLAAAWLFQRYKTTKEDVAPTPTVGFQFQEALFTLENAFVTNIDFSDQEGNAISIQRDTTSAEWTVPGEDPEMVDTFRVSTIAGQLFALRILSSMDTAPALASVGLDEPLYTITMTTDSGEQITLYVGSVTAIGNGYYVRVDREPVVVVDKIELDAVLDILVNRPLLATSTPEVTFTPEITGTLTVTATISLTPEAPTETLIPPTSTTAPSATALPVTPTP